MGEVETQQQRSRDLADAVCAKDPIQTAVRDELLRLEAVATAQANGYNLRDLDNTHLYQVSVNQDTGEATSSPLRTLTTVLRFFAGQFNQSVPVVLEHVSMLLANPELGPPAPEGVNLVDSIDKAVCEWNLPEGWEIHGIGVISLAHSVRTDAPGFDNITAADLDESNPSIRACWYTHLVGRDSRIWTVMHQEGYDVVYGSSGPDEPAEGVLELEALTRLVNLATKA